MGLPRSEVAICTQQCASEFLFGDRAVRQTGTDSTVENLPGRKENKNKTLCNISGICGGDYEECRLLGYKNQVHTSQETRYISATESSQLMLCKI
jgi:hypothetical protein